MCLQLSSQQTVATDSPSHLVGHIQKRWLVSLTGLGWCRMPFLVSPSVSICLPVAFACSNFCHFHPWEFWGLSMFGLVLIANLIVSIGCCHYYFTHIFHPVCLESIILDSSCFSDHRSCHFLVGFSDRMCHLAEPGMAFSTRSRRAHMNSFCHTCIFRLFTKICKAMFWRCCRACLPFSSWVLLEVAINKDTKLWAKEIYRNYLRRLVAWALLFHGRNGSLCLWHNDHRFIRACTIEFCKDSWVFLALSELPRHLTMIIITYKSSRCFDNYLLRHSADLEGLCQCHSLGGPSLKDLMWD